MRALTIIIFFFSVLPAFAQDDAQETSRVDTDGRARIRAAHAAYITERLGLTPEEAEKFWPVYHEYKQKQRTLRQQFREAKKDGLDERALLELDLDIKQKTLDLEKEYSNRFQKIITPQKLMNLRQAEADFRKLLLRQIQQRERQQMRNRQQRRQLRNY